MTASATANYAVDKDISADVTVNEKGDVKATLSHAGVLEGLKTAVSGEPANAAKTLKPPTPTSAATSGSRRT